MAQEAAQKEMANSRLRHLPAQNRSFGCTDAEVGDSALFYEAVNRKSAPRRRDSAVIPEIDETGVAAKFQSQTSIVVRYCVTRQGVPRDVGGEE